MSRYYEKELPDGYMEALTVDANDKKSGLKIQLTAIVVAVLVCNAFFFAYVWPNRIAIRDGFAIVKCVVFAISYPLYVSLHELTHGAVYKLLTRQKLTFGFKPPAAYCGVPDIYVYRIVSLLSLFAPLTIYGVLLTVSFFVVGDPFSKMLILAMLALHVIGCAGDLYGIGLFLFRFRKPDTLRKDTGPLQIYYIKDPET